MIQLDPLKISNIQKIESEKIDMYKRKIKIDRVLEYIYLVVMKKY